MAPKRSSPLEEPPAVSSSEEEEVESEEEEESDEEEKSEQKQEPKNATTSIPPPTPALSKNPETRSQSSSSDSGSDSGSESDSDHPPRGVVDPTVKPIASKPMDDASKLKKPRSKSVAAIASASVVATPTKSAGKRPVENIAGEGKDSKRAKKKSAEAGQNLAVGTAGEDSKRPLFQRLWSEEDEIVILKGMIDYTAKKEADPLADLDAFHDFIKKSLHIEVMMIQLKHKMQRLKRKYQKNAKKGKNGGDRTFSNPHEQKAYDLSKIIWGREAINGGGANQAKSKSKSNGKAKKSDKSLTPTEKEELLASLLAPKAEPTKKDTVGQNVGHSEVSNHSILLNRSIASDLLDHNLMKEGLALIHVDKRSELEEEWRKLQVAEMEIFLRRIELVREQTKLAFDAYKKQPNL